MDVVASRSMGGTPGNMPAPGSVGRPRGAREAAGPAKAVSPADRSALRHASDVLADYLQCDSKG